jgi:archaellum component FlaC
MTMTQEDIKNLVGWLQAIHKESQLARGGVEELKRNVNMIPEIRDTANRGTQDSGDAERKIEDTRNHLEDRMNKIEDILNDLRGDVREIRSKIDRIK